MIDTGIMNGADIVASVALGAKFTLIGRAYLYGLMAGRGCRPDDRHPRRPDERTMTLLGVAASTSWSRATSPSCAPRAGTPVGAADRWRYDAATRNWVAGGSRYSGSWLTSSVCEPTHRTRPASMTMIRSAIVTVESRCATTTRTVVVRATGRRWSRATRTSLTASSWRGGLVEEQQAGAAAGGPGRSPPADARRRTASSPDGRRSSRGPWAVRPTMATSRVVRRAS